MEIRYTIELPRASALEEEVREARIRHRARLDALTCLSTEHVALGEEMSADADAIFARTKGGQTWWSRVRTALGRPRSPAGVSDLEERLETAQRRVIALAHHIDRLTADRAVSQREIASLESRIAQCERCSEQALASLRALQSERDASGGLSPLALDAKIAQREAEHHAFQRAIRRLSAIVSMHEELLQLDTEVEKRLNALHTAGSDLLDALDADLARLATESHLKQLAAAFATDLGALRDSVARVNRLATESAVLLTEELDRLADEVDPLAPLDPDAAAAERELSVHLRDRTVAQAIARTRQRTALEVQRSRRAAGDETDG